MSETVIRHAEAADLEAITALYNHYVENTAVTFDIVPFSAKVREPWLGQFSKSGRYRLLVAEAGGRLIGYASSTRHRAKPAYDPSIETTIYLAPNCARQGLGRLLYERLFSVLADEDVHYAYAGIALPNPASVAFHAALGFKEIGTFHEVGRKFGRFHDVMWFEKRLG